MSKNSGQRAQFLRFSTAPPSSRICQLGFCRRLRVGLACQKGTEHSHPGLNWGFVEAHSRNTDQSGSKSKELSSAGRFSRHAALHRGRLGRPRASSFDDTPLARTCHGIGCPRLPWQRVPLTRSCPTRSCPMRKGPAPACGALGRVVLVTFRPPGSLRSE